MKKRMTAIMHSNLSRSIVAVFEIGTMQQKEKHSLGDVRAIQGSSPPLSIVIIKYQIADNALLVRAELNYVRPPEVIVRGSNSRSAMRGNMSLVELPNALWLHCMANRLLGRKLGT